MLRYVGKVRRSGKLGAYQFRRRPAIVGGPSRSLRQGIDTSVGYDVPMSPVAVPRLRPEPAAREPAWAASSRPASGVRVRDRQALSESSVPVLRKNPRF